MRNSNRTGNSYGSQTRLQFKPLSAKPELSQFLQKLEVGRYHANILNWVRSESDYKWLALGFGAFGFDGRKVTEGGGRTWWCSPWATTRRMAAALSQASPQAKRGERERERDGRTSNISFSGVNGLSGCFGCYQATAAIRSIFNG